jgi:DNA-binding transcriptional LysR family regulator
VTLRQLSYLLAVADTGSFTAAARRMHVSQPTLSQQIRSLEAELGGVLLDRPPLPVGLTAAGKAFAAEARVAVGAAHRAADAARATMSEQVREVRVATVSSLVTQLPDAIKRWQTSYPGITVHLTEHAHRHVVAESVLHRRSELGIGPRPVGWPGVVSRLGWDELVVVLSRSEPMAKASRVALGSLASRGWVLFEPGHGLAGIVAWACTRAGFEPRGVAYTEDVEAAARLAAAGVGPALVPAKAVPSEYLDHIRRLDAPVVWEISAYAAGRTWSRRQAKLLEGLIDVGGWERRRPRGSVKVTLDGEGG